MKLASRSTRGVYFVTTSPGPPYAMGPLTETTLIVEEPEPVVAESETPLTPEELENEQLFLNNTIAFRSARPH